jgi:hypothetical protein
MARTKRPDTTQPTRPLPIARFPSRVYWCTEPGCSKHYLHRQSLKRHRARNHGRSPSVQESQEPVAPATSPNDGSSFEGLLRYVEAASSGAPSPASTTGLSAAAVTRRTVAPWKEMTSRSSGRRQTVDGIARRWRSCPIVSTDAVYGMLMDMPSQSPFTIASAAQRRFVLTGRQRVSLRWRLSAAAHAVRCMVAEIRDLVPFGTLDANTAIAAMHRLETLLQRCSQRPRPRVNE